MEDIKKFYKKIKDINYGWHDKKGKVHEHLSEGNYQKNFKMQNIKEIKKSNYAVCWEMCELERNYFKKRKINYKTIFSILTEDKNFPCHTFLVFEYQKKWYWFEASWKGKKGIHEYNTLEEILDAIRNDYYDFAKKEYDPKKVKFYEYKKPIISRMSCNLFYYHCLHSKRIG